MYNIEIFDAINHVVRTAILIEENFDVVVDAISPTTFDLVAKPRTPAEIMDTIRIKKGSQTIFIGYVKEVQRSAIATTITCGHPLDLLDKKTRLFRADESATEGQKTWGYAIWWEIQRNFVIDDNIICKLPIQYHSSYPYTNWGDWQPTYGRVIESVKSAIITAEKQRNLYLRYLIGTGESNLGIIYYGFSKPNTDNPYSLDIDGEFIINKTVEIDSDYGRNLAFIWGKNGYHWGALVNKQFTTDIELRRTLVNPVVVAEDWSDKETYTEDDVMTKLQNMLPVEGDDIYITVQVPYENNFVPSYREGSVYKLYDGDKVYTATLTGRRYMGNIIELTFGTVRANLTQKLNAERK